MKQAIIFFQCFLAAASYGQTGPNSPSSGSTDNTVPGTSWNNPGHIQSSDNTYATIAPVAGTTELLRGRNFGFSLLSTDIVQGIKVEIEKSQAPHPVTISGSWTVGTSRPALAAGINRCLIVTIGVENELVRDIATVTYGGKAMTLASHVGLGTPFYAATDVWYMTESDLSSTSGTTISYTFGTGVASQNFEIVASALFVNVDQASPFVNTQTASTVSSSGTFTFSPALTDDAGGFDIFTLFNGNPVPGSAGDCTSTSVNSGFTKVVDHLNYNSGWTSSGGTLMVATKSETTSGSEAPVFTSVQSPNRRTVTGVSLRRARNFDNAVQLRKSAGWISTNEAHSTTDWPTTDTYVSYGSASDLWGTSWAYSDINNAQFGAGISAAMKNNGTLSVDHMRITVYTSSILPVELISLEAQRSGKRAVALEWLLGSEFDVDHYTIERSIDGSTFTAAGTVVSEGSTASARKYNFTDENAEPALSYYRLKTTNKNGETSYSQIVSVSASEADATLYPNPAAAFSHLDLSGKTNEVIVTDLNGRVIEQFEGSSFDNHVLINLENAPDGTYLVIIRTPSGSDVKKLQKVSALNQ